MSARLPVVVAGPASWNHLIHLDRLPEPRPHMQFATRAYHAVGGTSAGKAVHLAGLGVPTTLHALLASDEDGDRIATALRGAGVDLARHPSVATERHVNLLTERGERVSLYVSTPSPATVEVVDAVARAAAGGIAVIDLSELGARVLDRLGRDAHIWTDLHDYDGTSAFHEPFVRAAEAVFMNADAVDDPWALLRRCLDKGPRLGVCTLGAEGAIALTADGQRASVSAVPTDVVDANGAGDAFFAGVLAATLDGATLTSALSAGAEQAAVALRTEHLHPALATAPTS